ncbi:RNA-binding protein 28 isoform X2 [Salarias fasciatus]|uniref:RNA-binding protein 28 n=1 Tax=Salarias fasciatus TaxID=181472 RepID=A0A672GQF7_SALFA|nr:RNA-binding protein 28 isoform X2 [Salarias fasciatus]
MASPTVFVGSLPASASNERLEEIFSEIGPVKQCFVVKKKGAEKCQGYGFVTFSMLEDAQRALKEVKDYDGHKLFLSVAKKKMRDKKKKAGEESGEAPEDSEQKPKASRKKAVKARLIIRNLSFKCTEDELKEIFGKFGTVVDAYIPLKPDGKMRGFGFVLFKTVSGAAKALSEMNLKEIKGRQVAVDWAVTKEKYVATQQPSTSDKNKTEETTAKSKSDSGDDDDGNDDDDNDDNDDSDDDDGEDGEQKTQATSEKKKVSLKPAVKQDEESSEDEDDGMEEDSEEEEDDEGKEKDDDDDESDFDANDDEDDSEEEDGNDEDESAQKKTVKKQLPSDVKEGRTVFIRNLSFDTEEEGLEEVLLRFGELNYIKIVLHPDTDHSKGCAFAQFKTKEAADSCIAAAQDAAENGGVRADGRKLLIVAAVSRDDAVKLKVNKTKVETGSRNLYLAREGLIRAGTKAAEGVSEADMIKRTRFEEVKRTKLRDLNVFVSKTRLCIHNLPKSVDSKKLRTLCLQAFKGVKGVRISECRVMYDKKPEKGQVMGQSLGYAFAQFGDHEHALAVLRHLNNNPDIFGPHKRPIVEFSLEDLRKLKVKEMRQNRNKEMARNPQFKGGQKPDGQKFGAGKGSTQGGNKAQSSPQQAGRQKGAPVHSGPQRKRGGYSGFHTNPEVEHVDLENGKKRRKVLPLPSHRGPKIRMRDKGKQQAAPPKKGRPGPNRNQRQRRQMGKPTHFRNQAVKTPKKQFKKREGDRFDSLVEKYKSKLMGGSKDFAAKRNKWFDN